MVALVKIEVVVDLDNLKFNWTLVVLNAFGWDVLHFNAHNPLDINLKKNLVPNEFYMDLNTWEVGQFLMLVILICIK